MQTISTFPQTTITEFPLLALAREKHDRFTARDNYCMIKAFSQIEKDKTKARLKTDFIDIVKSFDQKYSTEGNGKRDLKMTKGKLFP